MNENRPNLRTATPEKTLFSLVVVAGEAICFVVGNMGSAGVKVENKGSAGVKT